MVLTGYYGLLRVGELTISPHTIKAMDVHKAENKNKILICLRTSKTHDRSNQPQIIKLDSVVRTAKMKKELIVLMS